MVNFVLFAIGAILAFFAWKFVDYFFSRRDRYVNSPYQLVKKKIRFVASALFIPFFIYYLIILPITRKTKENIQNKNGVVKILRTQNPNSIEITELPMEQLEIVDSTDGIMKVRFISNGRYDSGFVQLK